MLTNTCPKLQQKDSNSKSERAIWGGTELYGFRARTGGAALSRAKVQASTTVPLLIPPLHSLQVGAGVHQIWVSINLANIACPTQLTCLAQISFSNYSTQVVSLDLCCELSKISQRSTNQKQGGWPWLSSPKPGTSGSQLQFAAQPLPGIYKLSTGSYQLQIKS